MLLVLPCFSVCNIVRPKSKLFTRGSRLASRPWCSCPRGSCSSPPPCACSWAPGSPGPIRGQHLQVWPIRAHHESVPPQPVQRAVVHEVLPLELEVVLLLDPDQSEISTWSLLTNESSPGVLLRRPRVLHGDGHDAEWPGQGGQVHVLFGHPGDNDVNVNPNVHLTLFSDHSRRWLHFSVYESLKPRPPPHHCQCPPPHPWRHKI